VRVVTAAIVDARRRKGPALITPELRKKIEDCHSLPTPPGVATKIIELAHDPEADIARIADVLAHDPAITAKILRIANSPMYARQRKTENLRQALMVIGLNATISLALSFSLLKSWQGADRAGGLDYPLYWRRALLGATASHVLARIIGVKDGEELFLACLIQDIGVMALDHAVPDLYAGLGSQQGRQAALIEREQERLGVDHAAVSGWLLEKWQFPERMQQVVAASHDPDRLQRDSADARFARCVSLASMIAELFLDTSGARGFAELAQRAHAYFEIDKEGLGELLAEIGRMIPDAESIFDTEILSAARSEAILSDARDALMLRNLRALRDVEQLKTAAESLEERTRRLEESNKRDPLTNLFNRTYLDDYLRDAFQQSNRNDAPLAIAFADLDKFKSVNDIYGHAMGDQILVTTANILKANVRGADVVARYGGEEFILVFPNTEYPLLKTICERIVRAFRETRHDVGTKRDLNVTISIGMATHNDGRRFKNVEDLLKAADKALYTAKLQGRNRSVPFDLVANTQIASM
jgi:diguanylate cyclase (GGDEF)-like protein